MPISTSEAFAFGSGTVGVTVVALADLTGLDAALVAQADRARVGVSGADVRYRYDGGDPAADSGHYLPANGETGVIGRGNVANLRFIRAGGVDATVSVTLERV